MRNGKYNKAVTFPLSISPSNKNSNSCNFDPYRSPEANAHPQPDASQCIMEEATMETKREPSEDDVAQKPQASPHLDAV